MTSDLDFPCMMLVTYCFVIPIAIPYLIASCLFISAVFFMSLICLSVYFGFGPGFCFCGFGGFSYFSGYGKTSFCCFELSPISLTLA